MVQVEPDVDGDGIPDSQDLCPNQVGVPENSGCPVVDLTDYDGDGLGGPADLCPDEPGSHANDGCPTGEPDADGDGVPDAQDECPNEFGPGQNLGCPDPNLDGDGDGIPNGEDQCPNEMGPANNFGCPIVDGPLPDTDGDGVADVVDECPEQVGTPILNGCPFPEGMTDTDGDGIPDEYDECPEQAGPEYNAGCPDPNADSDGDGLFDSDDACPNQGDEGAGIDEQGCPLPTPTVLPPTETPIPPPPPTAVPPTLAPPTLAPLPTNPPVVDVTDVLNDCPELVATFIEYPTFVISYLGGSANACEDAQDIVDDVLTPADDLGDETVRNMMNNCPVALARYLQSSQLGFGEEEEEEMPMVFATRITDCLPQQATESQPDTTARVGAVCYDFAGQWHNTMPHPVEVSARIVIRNGRTFETVGWTDKLNLTPTLPAGGIIFFDAFAMDVDLDQQELFALVYLIFKDRDGVVEGYVTMEGTATRKAPDQDSCEMGADESDLIVCYVMDVTIESTLDQTKVHSFMGWSVVGVPYPESQDYVGVTYPHEIEPGTHTYTLYMIGRGDHDGTPWLKELTSNVSGIKVLNMTLPERFEPPHCMEGVTQPPEPEVTETALPPATTETPTPDTLVCYEFMGGYINNLPVDVTMNATIFNQSASRIANAILGWTDVLTLVANSRTDGLRFFGIGTVVDIATNDVVAFGAMSETAPDGSETILAQINGTAISMSADLSGCNISDDVQDSVVCYVIEVMVQNDSTDPINDSFTGYSTDQASDQDATSIIGYAFRQDFAPGTGVYRLYLVGTGNVSGPPLLKSLRTRYNALQILTMEVLQQSGPSQCVGGISPQPEPTVTPEPTVPTTDAPPTTSTGGDDVIVVGEVPEGVTPDDIPLVEFDSGIVGVFEGSIPNVAPNSDLYLLHLAGIQPLITNTLEQETNPQFSPDGDWVAFVQTNLDGSTTLRMIHAETLEQVDLVNSTPAMTVMTFDPTWEPDASAIYFTVAGSDGVMDIHRLPIQNGQALNSQLVIEDGYSPGMSASGNYMAFVRVMDGVSVVHSFTPNTNQITVISDATSGNCYQPAFGTDTVLLTYVCEANGETILNVYLYGVGGTNILQPQDASFANPQPGPSKGFLAYDDGKTIWFTDESGENRNVLAQFADEKHASNLSWVMPW